MHYFFISGSKRICSLQLGTSVLCFRENTKTPSPSHASADRADRKSQAPPRPLKSWFPPHPLERLAGVSSTHHGSSVVVGFQSMVRKTTMAMYSKKWLCPSKHPSAWHDSIPGGRESMPTCRRNTYIDLIFLLVLQGNFLLIFCFKNLMHLII